MLRWPFDRVAQYTRERAAMSAESAVFVEKEKAFEELSGAPYLLKSKLMVFIEIPSGKPWCRLRFDDLAPSLPSVLLYMQCL